MKRILALVALAAWLSGCGEDPIYMADGSTCYGSTDENGVMHVACFGPDGGPLL